MKKDKGIIAYIVFITLFLIFTIFFTFHLYNQNGIIKIENFTLNNHSDNMHLRALDGNEKKTFIFTTGISRDQFKILDDGPYKITMNGISAHGYKIFFNGLLLGSYGDQENGYSNIWNAVKSFDLDPDIIKDKNQLKIEMSATYQLGAAQPVIISDSRTAYLIDTWFNVVLENINVIAIGFLVFSIALMYFLHKRGSEKKENIIYLYISIASIFLSLSLIRTLTMPFLLVPEIVINKVCTSFIYIAAYLISMGLYRQYNHKINKWSAYLALISSVVLLIYPSQYFLRLELGLTIIILTNVSAWIYTSSRYKDRSKFIRLFFWASLFTIITIILAVISIFVLSFFVIKLSYIGLFIFSLSIIFYLIIEFISTKDEVEIHKNTAEEMYERAIRDSMTGIYNHGYIAATLEKTERPYALIIMDIDDFKEINDQYGHQAGDIVIKNVASQIKRNIRNTDIVGRYGGDEFVIVLNNCQTDLVEKVARKIKESIEKPQKTQFGNIQVTVSMGIYITEDTVSGNQSLLKADKALYYVKNHGKAQIKILKKAENPSN